MARKTEPREGLPTISEKDKRNRDVTTETGYEFVRPVQYPEESDEQFQKRVDDFNRRKERAERIMSGENPNENPDEK